MKIETLLKRSLSSYHNGSSCLDSCKKNGKIPNTAIINTKCNNNTDDIDQLNTTEKGSKSTGRVTNNEILFLEDLL